MKNRTIFQKELKMQTNRSEIEKGDTDAHEQRSRKDKARKEYSPAKRGVEVIESVHEHRFMTALQINDLHFPTTIIYGKRQVHSNCQYHLRQLVANGYLVARKLPPSDRGGRSEHVYAVAKGGAEVLAERWGCSIADLDWDRTDQAIRRSSLPHYVASTEVRIRVEIAIRNHTTYCLKQWLSERDLQRKHKGIKLTITTPEGRQQQVSIEPDQFFLFTTPKPESEEPSRYFRFIEVDLGTEPINASRYDRSSFVRKVLSYLEFYRSGQYQRLYEAKGMVVLTITTTEQRLASMLKVTEQAGGRDRFWFATFDRLRSADILCDPVWSRVTRPERSSLVW